MIVGHGMLARAFAREFGDDSAHVVFASGVSNSNERRPEAFAREEALLRSAIAGNKGTIVYFGTCSVLDTERRDTPYVRHKLAMEALAQASDRAVVLRLPQVVGRTDNPHTLMNYLHERIRSGERFEVWQDAWRNVIDVDDVAAIGGAFIRDPACRHRVVNIASPQPVKVTELVEILARVLGREARFARLPRGDRYDIDVAEAMAVAERIGVRFGSDYVDRLVRT